jgi:hypothetical protein
MSYFYWTDKVDGYVVQDADEQVLAVKRLNFFIGKNNSGKSRFLRGLYSEHRDFCDFTLSCRDELKKFYFEFNDFLEGDGNILSKINSETQPKSSFLVSSKNEKDLNVDFLLENITLNLMRKKILSFLDLGEKYFFMNGARRVYLEEKINKLGSIKVGGQKITFSRVYLPVLRGLRPISSDSKDCYKKRTQEDYFKIDGLSGGVITGEDFYDFLRHCLLGEPEQRDLIRKYEDLLGQYFFEGQKIALIPKHSSDVVHIKIGDEKQFPIYHLGDGLQQAIILTYQCYLQKDSVCAFFIEEPELHMHAGMVRQLMNFYLNETKHYYFFTTHSNHLLDMVDESDEVVIQKFTKNKKEDGSSYFEIKRCDKDRELLAALGVRPSSVYLANCTIWVEGITDRLYLVKYMQKYLEDLKNSNDPRFLKYRGFMPNFHYTFVEYQGSNLVHWNFDEEDQDFLDNQGLNALSVCSDMLLIADGDIQDKGSRVADLQTALGQERFYLLPCKETENTLPPKILINLAIEMFGAMKTKTQEGFSDAALNTLIESEEINIFSRQSDGIGQILDSLIRSSETDPSKRAFADESGTIKSKLGFCRRMLEKMDDLSAWELTEEAKALCEKIFTFIEDHNQDMLKPQDQ